MRHLLLTIKMAMIKKAKGASTGKDGEIGTLIYIILEPIYIDGERVKLCSHSEGSLAVSLKVIPKINIRLSNYIPRYIPKRTENIFL